MGVATTAVHYGVLVALVEAWAVNPVAATTAGFLAAVLLSYLLNRRYTFDELPAFHAGLVKYCAAVSIGLVLNAGTVALLTGCGILLPAGASHRQRGGSRLEFFRGAACRLQPE